MEGPLPKFRGCNFQIPKVEDSEKQEDRFGSVIEAILKEKKLKLKGKNLLRKVLETQRFSNFKGITNI